MYSWWSCCRRCIKRFLRHPPVPCFRGGNVDLTVPLHCKCTLATLYSKFVFSCLLFLTLELECWWTQHQPHPVCLYAPSHSWSDHNTLGALCSMILSQPGSLNILTAQVNGLMVHMWTCKRPFFPFFKLMKRPRYHLWTINISHA